MARRSSMYKSNKRKKELKRQKKQEEKRQRHQKSNTVSSQEPEGTDSINIDSETSGDIPAVTDK